MTEEQLQKRRAYDRLRNKNDPKRIAYRKGGRHAYNLKKRYGLSIEEYKLLVEKTNNKCVICSKDLIFGVSAFNEPINAGNNSAISCIDHDHRTGKVREIICIKCNSVIGLTDERIEVLESTIKYLKKHAKTL